MLLLLLLLPILASSQHSHSKPKITSSILNQTVVAGERAVFSCTARGQPRPNLIINKKQYGHIGLDFPDRDGHRDVSESVTVERVFEPVTLEDEGWYKCFALNQRDIVSTKAYLTVLDGCEARCEEPKVCVKGVCTCQRECLSTSTYSPVCASNCKTFFDECQMEVQSCKLGVQLRVLKQGLCSGILGPTLTVERREIGLVPGTGAVLSVSVAGYPAPTVTWYRDLGQAKSEEVGQGASVIVSTTGTYFAEALNCATNLLRSTMVVVSEAEITESPATTTQPLTEGPGELNVSPKLEDMNSCTILGGAHILSFDRWMYEFDGMCTYVLVGFSPYSSAKL